MNSKLFILALLSLNCAVAKAVPADDLPKGAASPASLQVCGPNGMDEQGHFCIDPSVSDGGIRAEPM